MEITIFLQKKSRQCLNKELIYMFSYKGLGTIHFCLASPVSKLRVAALQALPFITNDDDFVCNSVKDSLHASNHMIIDAALSVLPRLLGQRYLTFVKEKKFLIFF
jgi:hypothetical protein